MFEEKILKALLEEQRILSADVLVTPPPDYAGFMRVVGEYRGLQLAVDLVGKILKGKETE